MSPEYFLRMAMSILIGGLDLPDASLAVEYAPPEFKDILLVRQSCLQDVVDFALFSLSPKQFVKSRWTCDDWSFPCWIW